MADGFLQLSPPLHVETSKGPGWAHFVRDYGTEASVVWGVALDASGDVWWVPNPEVKLSWNWTMGRRRPADGGDHEQASSELRRLAGFV